MSLQAFLVAVAGVLLGLVMFFVYPHVATAISGLLVMGVFFLYAYNINCSIVGNCSVLAWALTAIFLISACLKIVAVVALRGTIVQSMTAENLVRDTAPTQVFNSKSPVRSSLRKVVDTISPKK
jgi:hypothetical protein